MLEVGAGKIQAVSGSDPVNTQDSASQEVELQGPGEKLTQRPVAPEIPVPAFPARGWYSAVGLWEGRLAGVRAENKGI